VRSEVDMSRQKIKESMMIHERKGENVKTWILINVGGMQDRQIYIFFCGFILEAGEDNANGNINVTPIIPGRCRATCRNMRSTIHD